MSTVRVQDDVAYAGASRLHLDGHVRRRHVTDIRVQRCGDAYEVFDLLTQAILIRRDFRHAILCQGFTAATKMREASE